MPFDLSARFLRRLLSELLVLLILLSAGIVWLSGTSGARQANHYLYDFFLSMHTRSADERIVLIEIDQRSLSELGRWPWNRQVHATMFKALEAQSPKAVLLDVLFTEPSDNPRDDAALAAAMRRMPHLAIPILMQNESNQHVLSTLPVEPIRSSALLGEIAVLPDADGLVRSVSLHQTDGNMTRWPLLTTLLMDASLRPAPVAAPLAEQTVADDIYMIPFNIPQGRFLSFSYTDLLNGRIPADFLKDKYVLIGATAAGLGDQYPTPISRHNSNMPGIEIHANILDGLLNGIHIRTLDESFVAKSSVLVPVFAFFMLLLWLRERFHLLGLLAFTALYLVVVGVALHYLHIWLAPACGLIGIALAYLLWSWRRLSVFQNHINFELNQLRVQTGHLFQMLPFADNNRSVFRPHALEMNIERVHRLGHFVTDSLQQLPMAVLLFDDSGKVLMHNQLATRLLGSDIDYLNVKDVFQRFCATDVCSGVTQSNWSTLNELELSSVSGQSFVMHCVKIELQQPRFIEHLDDSSLWQISMVDLTNERKAQQQRNDLMTYMSHDLRSPQVGILSMIQLFKSDTYTMGIDEFIEGISHNAHATLNSASALLNLARAQDKSYYVMQDVNLLTTMQAAIEQMWAQALAKRITVTLEATANDNFDALWTLGDGDMLLRTFVNILSNAIRYSPEDSVVTLHVVCIGNHIECAISDQGRGMSEAELDLLNNKLFAQKSRNGSETDAAGSFGVGLRMVAAVVAQHDGTLLFESSAGEGTTVRMFLPAEDEKLGFM